MSTDKSCGEAEGRQGMNIAIVDALEGQNFPLLGLCSETGLCCPRRTTGMAV